MGREKGGKDEWIRPSSSSSRTVLECILDWSPLFVFLLEDIERKWQRDVKLNKRAPKRRIVERNEYWPLSRVLWGAKREQKDWGY